LFTGEYEHTIDAKQRLAIPAEIRSQLDPKLHGEAFYAGPGPNSELWLWPERTFERMATAVEDTLLRGQEMMEFEESVFPRSRRLEIDKAGRVRLPDQMLTEFGLSQTVVILGVKDHLELRDPQRWRARRQQTIAKQPEIMLRAREAMIRHLPGGGQKDRP
jgi:MraZ protein